MKLLSIGKTQKYFLTDVLEATLTEGEYTKNHFGTSTTTTPIC